MAGRDEVPGLGAALVVARERAGLTQATAAEAAKVDRVGIARYETEVRVPTVAVLRRLAIAYGVGIDKLLAAADRAADTASAPEPKKGKK